MPLLPGRDRAQQAEGTKLTMEHHLGSFWRIPPVRNLMDLAMDRMSDSFMTRVKDTLETQAEEGAAPSAR